jgi:hypothetical protein
MTALSGVRDVLPAINPATDPTIAGIGAIGAFRIEDATGHDRLARLTPEQRDHVAAGVIAVMEELAGEFDRRKHSLRVGQAAVASC